MTLRVYDSDGTVHDYMNVHQIIDVDGSVLIIYTDMKDDKLKCVGHDKINVDSMGIRI